MKTCLVQPPQTELYQPKSYISLGLAYIGAVLENSGVEVELLNLANENRLYRQYPEADWYGITCMTATYEVTRKLVNILKGKGLVAVGGPHATVMPRETYQDMKPDVVIAGEAELLFSDLVKNNVVVKPIIDAGIIKNLSSLPFPARHLYPTEDVVDTTGIHGQEKGVRATTVITSRGCPYHCQFCCKNHPMYTQYRYRNELDVKQELLFLKKTYCIEHVRFIDDEFTVNRSRTIKLMDAIESLDLTWVCITRADSLDQDLLEKMKEAGCVEVHIGVETGSDRLLKLMNKQTTSKVILKAIKTIKEAGIRVKTYLMFDYPEETEEDRDKTVKLIREAKPDRFTLSKFTPLPGSAIYKPHQSRRWFYPDEEDPQYLEYKERIVEASKNE